jgi:hypothetical protein
MTSFRFGIILIRDKICCTGPTCQWRIFTPRPARQRPFSIWRPSRTPPPCGALSNATRARPRVKTPGHLSERTSIGSRVDNQSGGTLSERATTPVRSCHSRAHIEGGSPHSPFTVGAPLHPCRHAFDRSRWVAGLAPCCPPSRELTTSPPRTAA